MIRKSLYSIGCTILIWVLGVCTYLLSFNFSFLENLDLQANIALSLALVPSTCLGTYLFYKKSYIKPSLLGLTFIIVIAILDASITVPVFLVPIGISHYDFFGDLKFYAIALELYLVVLFFGNRITNRVTA